VSGVTRLHLGLILTALPVALACFSDPIANSTSGDGDGDASETGDGDGDSGDGDGDGEPGDGDGDGEPGDGDGEPGDGDGDGDGDRDPVCGDGLTVLGELCLSETPTQYPAGQAVQRLAVGEFNPGALGVVAVGFGAMEASLLRGDGSGALLGVELLPLLGGSYSVAAGDVDNDGDVDFATDGDPSTVMLNDGVGGWESVLVEVSFGFSSYRLLLGQIDGNAPLDLVYSEGYNTRWIPGTPFGGWSPGTAASAQFTGGDSWLALTQFGDGDNFTDLLVASQWDANIAIVRGQGDGTAMQVGDAAVCNPGACEITELQAIDVNGDDDPDIIASHESGFSVLLALGGATFGNYQLNPSPGADHISSGDIDNDGDTDLVVASRVDGDLRLFLGDGTGTFGQPIVYDVPGDETRTTAMVDLDGDGALELLTAYQFNGGGWIGVFEANP
jgi:hypothetical protein